MSDPERIERIRTGVIMEADLQYTGDLAPELASPLYLHLCLHIAKIDHYLELMNAARQPNVRLFLGAVHRLILGGAQHDLAAYYMTVGGKRAPDDALNVTFDDFVSTNEADITALMARHGVQTNEVRRGATLWAAFSAAQSLAGQPLALIELGCSAGLLLGFDRYGYWYSDGRRAGDISGSLQVDCRLDGDRTPPVASAIDIASRVGIDRDPVDLQDADAVAWMRSCIWGDHADRLAQFDAGIEILKKDPPRVLEGDMIATLPIAVEQAPDDAMVCVYHTNAVNYLKRDKREELVAKLHELSRTRPIVWISGEGPGVIPGHPTVDQDMLFASVLLVMSKLRDGNASHEVLALAGAQGGWLRWDA